MRIAVDKEEYDAVMERLNDDLKRQRNNERLKLLPAETIPPRLNSDEQHAISMLLSVAGMAVSGGYAASPDVVTKAISTIEKRFKHPKVVTQELQQAVLGQIYQTFDDEAATADAVIRLVRQILFDSDVRERLAHAALLQGRAVVGAEYRIARHYGATAPRRKSRIGNVSLSSLTGMSSWTSGSVRLLLPTHLGHKWTAPAR
jgi:hypothetical protein